jgi:hypothetical protein
MAEVGPVHLRLFAREAAQTQIGLGFRSRPMASDDMAEVIGTAVIATLAHHRIEAAGRQRRECFQRLADEWQIGVDLRRTRWRPELGQTGLRQHAPHHAVVHVQLTGDGANRPFLSVIVAQDLDLDVRRNHHVRILSGRASASLDDGSGGAETLGGRDPGSGDRTSDNAKPLAGAPHPRKPRRSQSPASRPIEDHPTAASVNPDASLYCSAPGNDALARHGRAAHDGWSGSAVRRRPACGAALAARSRRRNKLGRDRNNCRSGFGRDNPHKEIVEPAVRHDARTRKDQVDERHDCQDNHPAYVPSTVWGTASRRNSQVGLGAVLALDNEQALIAPSTPRQPRTARADGKQSSTKSSLKPRLRQSHPSNRYSACQTTRAV